jgi:hypothetical protein
MARHAEILAAHDLALSANVAALLGPPVAPLRASADYRKAEQKFMDFVGDAGAAEELAVFRSDKEKRPGTAPPASPDISRLFQPQPQTLENKLIAAHFFLRAVDAFPIVRTDRLHVAIAGAMLGKQVWLYPNSYYKNRAVYEFSLRAFSNVHFAEE